MKRARLLLVVIPLACFGFGSGVVGSSLARAPSGNNPATGAVARAFQASYLAETSRNFAAALSALDALPPERQGSYIALLRRGWLAYLAGRSAESVASYTKAVAAEPESVEPRLGLLLPQMALRRWVDVEKTASEVLQRDPGSYLGRMRLGLAQYSLAKYRDAEASYQKVLSLHPADLEARSGLAWALLKQRKYGSAEGHFTAILEVSPKHPAATDGLLVARKR